MKLRTWYDAHRTVALVAAGFLALWIGSGVVLFLPSVDARPAAEGRAASPPAFETLGVSPREAIAAIPGAVDSADGVRHVGMGTLGARRIYRIVTVDRRVHLVDAATRELLEVDGAFAAELARFAYPGGEVAGVEKLTSNELGYPYGPLPVYRVVFDDSRGTLAYVAERDGRITWSTRLSRLRAGVTSLHDFGLLTLLPGHRFVRPALMLIGSLAAALVLATGATLQIRRWRRSR